MASHRSRAVTPGSLFLLAAFVLLLLSVISAPVTRFSKLGEDSAFTYGVLGYCPIGSGSCSSAGVGYDFPSGADTDYLLSSIRGTLSKILVVHIPAAALTLINLIFAGFAHLRSGAHSPRYLCFVAVLPLVSSVITLLAFVIDILVFWPHCAWGTWITLAAFILNMFASLLICCVSRTVKNRKARKRSIDQDADMNAADYYSQQRALDSKLATADANSLPKFASFEAPSNRTLNEPVGGSTTKLPLIAAEERVPLNPTLPNLSRAPSGSQNGDEEEHLGMMSDASRVGTPRRDFTRNVPMRALTGSPGQQGFPMPPQRGPGGGGYGPLNNATPPPPGGRNFHLPRRIPSDPRMRPHEDSPPPMPMGMGTRRPSDPRMRPPGGPIPPMPTMGQRALRRTSSQEMLNPGVMAAMAVDASPARGRMGPPSYVTNEGGMPMGMNPGPPPPMPPPHMSGPGGPGPPRPMGPPMGMGMGMRKSPSMPQEGSAPGSGIYRPASTTESGDYIPPRTLWSRPGRRGDQSDPNLAAHALGHPQPSFARREHNRTTSGASGVSAASGGYYEDVDPQYDNENADVAHPLPNLPAAAEGGVGLSAAGPGPMSPAASTSSHFTSISQRPVNPRYHSPPPTGRVRGGGPGAGAGVGGGGVGGGAGGEGEGGGGLSPQGPPKPDVLSGNPDFEIALPKRGKGPGRMGGGMGGLSGNPDFEVGGRGGMRGFR